MQAPRGQCQAVSRIEQGDAGPAFVITRKAVTVGYAAHGSHRRCRGEGFLMTPVTAEPRVPAPSLLVGKGSDKDRSRL